MDAVVLWNNIGTNADVASATGSAHAKLKDIKNAVSALESLSTGVFQFSTIGTTDGANTILNVSGSGWLLGVQGGSFSINIDGGGIKQIVITASGGIVLLWRFNTSCVVKSSSAASASNFTYVVLD
jgi:hypothetical protein